MLPSSARVQPHRLPIDSVTERCGAPGGGIGFEISEYASIQAGCVIRVLYWRFGIDKKIVNVNN
jgi:hypothetical protein